jgi:hypothetical protein
MPHEVYHSLRNTPVSALMGLSRHQVEAYARTCSCRTRLKLLALASML